MNTNDNENNQGNYCSVQASVSNEAEKCIDKELDCNTKHECKIEDVKKRFHNKEFLELVFSAVVAMAAIVSTIVAIFQWGAMRSQLTEMHDGGMQADKLIVQVSEQARVARDALIDSRLQFQKDQRPYVIPKAFPFPMSKDQEISVNLYSGNYGKTPAMKVGGVTGIFLGNEAMTKADDWFRSTAPKAFLRTSGAVIPPNTRAIDFDAIHSTVRSGHPINASELETLLAKDFSIVVVYRVAYSDTAGNEYWTDFCVSYLKTKAVVNCPKHNEVH